MPANAEISAEQRASRKPEKKPKPKKPKIVKQETDRDGVLLRVEKGREVKVPSKTLDRLLKLGFDLATRYHAAKELSAESEGYKDKIRKIAQRIPGLRGIISDTQGFQVTISEKRTRKVNSDLVKASLLPETWDALTREKWTGTLNIPTGLVKPDKVSQKIREALLGLEISEEALPTIFTQKIEPDIDMDELDRLIAEGQVTLPKGAIEEEVTLAIEPKILDPKLFT